MHPDAARELENLGGDPSDFAARQLTSRLAVEADLVIAMTSTHRNAVLNLAPQQLHRTFTLSEASTLAYKLNAQSVRGLADLRPQLAASDVQDIPDPIGRDRAFFAMVAAQIADLLPPVLELCRRG